MSASIGREIIVEQYWTSFPSWRQSLGGTSGKNGRVDGDADAVGRCARCT